jgi:hypothetical protein
MATPDSALAVTVLFAAATELPADACRELGRRLTEHLVVLAQNHRHDLHPLAHGDARFIGALRSVAEVVGHPPSTTEYVDEYDRRRALGDAGLPSISAILKHFDGWIYALAGAGLAPEVPPKGIQRRRQYKRRVVHRYSEHRLAEALQACARDIGRIPMVRDYCVWREDLLSGRPGKRPAMSDIPHYRTLYERFGSWSAALDAAGLDGRRQRRTETDRYSPLDRDEETE